MELIKCEAQKLTVLDMKPECVYTYMSISKSGRSSRIANDEEGIWQREEETALSWGDANNFWGTPNCVCRAFESWTPPRRWSLMGCAAGWVAILYTFEYAYYLIAKKMKFSAEQLTPLTDWLTDCSELIRNMVFIFGRVGSLFTYRLYVMALCVRLKCCVQVADCISIRVGH